MKFANPATCGILTIGAVVGAWVFSEMGWWGFGLWLAGIWAPTLWQEWRA